MNVLFLSVSTGEGHIKAAEAVKEYIDTSIPGSSTLIVDALKCASPIISKVIVGGYLNTVKSTPSIYGKLYKLSESGENVNDISKSFNNLLSRKIYSIIRSFSPSVIVCTHPFPLQMMSNLKKKEKIDVPVIAIITDFVNHLIWKHDNIDAYVVAHEYIKYAMVDMGIPENIIYTYGIPVSTRFLKSKPRKAALNKLGLKDMQTCLLMGGGLGFGQLSDIFQALLKSKREIQIITVTGKNAKLKEQLEEYMQKHEYLGQDKTVKILGYTNKVPDIMDVSDFIITKPGGMTISEALVKGLPILISSPIPGQEERNASFLLNTGVAARITHDDCIDNVLRQSIDNPLRLKHMREMARCLAKPNSSRDITNLISSLISEYASPDIRSL